MADAGKTNSNLLLCPRCGVMHPEVRVMKFSGEGPPSREERYSHWGMCPNRNEPILLIQRYKAGRFTFHLSRGESNVSWIRIFWLWWLARKKRRDNDEN